MTKYKYLKLNKYKKIRYLSINNKANLCVVFLHGFMSDLEGNKPKSLLKFCKNKKIGFLGLEYSGHGKSSGKFVRGNISISTHILNNLYKIPVLHLEKHLYFNAFYIHLYIHIHIFI